ncbi:hypothetical protein PybrP1_009781 [[Pythium] brassicae (nom. inval.)]|nr:hypothetical protein PybrP1_009781 [[Pythium] brassicae (nom. inval.)]
MQTHNLPEIDLQVIDVPRALAQVKERERDDGMNDTKPTPVVVCEHISRADFRKWLENHEDELRHWEYEPLSETHGRVVVWSAPSEVDVGRDRESTHDACVSGSTSGPFVLCVAQGTRSQATGATSVHPPIPHSTSAQTTALGRHIIASTSPRPYWNSPCHERRPRAAAALPLSARPRASPGPAAPEFPPPTPPNPRHSDVRAHHSLAWRVLVGLEVVHAAVVQDVPERRLHIVHELAHSDYLRLSSDTSAVVEYEGWVRRVRVHSRACHATAACTARGTTARGSSRSSPSLRFEFFSSSPFPLPSPSWAASTRCSGGGYRE